VLLFTTVDSDNGILMDIIKKKSQDFVKLGLARQHLST
jgi:hypothetical protein